MTFDGLLAGSAVALANAIRAKEVSSEEVVRAHLARIEAVNPLLNAVVQSDAEAAVAEARKADSLLAKGTVIGPLHGVPFTAKDAFETAGLVSTAGTGGRSAYMPHADAAVVSRLRGAGAILLGKTNVPELSLVYECDNSVYGRTNNPYDAARTPGGSCGGEAAIIAAGGSPLGLGSDSAGSIRVPAHFCGIAGMKPTAGRIPTTGHFPPSAGTLENLISVGLMARFVEDIVVALPLLTGTDWKDPAVVPVPVSVGDPGSIHLQGLRIAFYTDNGIVPPTPETAQAVRAAASALESAGMSVTEALPDGIELSFDIMNGYLSSDGGCSLEMLLAMAGTDIPHPLTQRLLDSMRGNGLSTAELGGLMVSWHLLRSMMISFMKDFDAIVCPVSACPAIPHGTSLDEDRVRSFSYSVTYNLNGWPAVAVRASTSPEGLPIGVQITARPWRDDVALAVARFLESCFHQRQGGIPVDR